MNKLYIIGDSTVSTFNDPYFYPRYGYATQLNNYFTIPIINLAKSGRSSSSFINEPEYQIFKKNLSKGDYILIAFGHNDEKYDDPKRFTNASLPLNDSKSFKYSLYNNYIKFAIEKEANIILCTPIPRLDVKNIYKGNSVHETKNGNYKEAIIELGKEINVLVIDLTSEISENLKKNGFDKSCVYFACIKGKKENNIIKPDLLTLDKTHLNIFGAKYVSYIFTQLIIKNKFSLIKYLKDKIEEPKIEKDLIQNEDYIFKNYNPPNLKNYNPTYEYFKIKKENFYGTAFGEFSEIINLNNKSLFAYEKEDNKFIIGEKEQNGHIHITNDAFPFIFIQSDINNNFIISCKGKILESNGLDEEGFGLMIRDDCYINNIEKNLPINSNFISSGIFKSYSKLNILFSRDEKNGLKCDGEIKDEKYDKDDIFYMEIIRKGQSIYSKLIFNKNEYKKNYVDFDLITIDNKFIYAGFFATRGILIEISELKFEIIGKSLQA